MYRALSTQTDQELSNLRSEVYNIIHDQKYVSNIIMYTKHDSQKYCTVAGS